MRYSGTFLLAATLPMLLCASAQAAAIDTFTVTPSGGGTAFTFQLPASPTAITVDPYGLDFQVYGVDSSTGLGNVLVFGTGDSGGLELETPQNVPIRECLRPSALQRNGCRPDLPAGNV